jgi:hypothetical protein
VGAGGEVTITPDVAAASNGLSVAFQQDGELPAQDSVDGVPAS